MRFSKKSVLFLLIMLVLSTLIGSAQEKNTKFRVAVIKYKTKEKVIETYTPFVNYIAGELGLKPELTVITDESLAYDLNEGKYDLGVFPPFPYLKAKIDFPELHVFASHIVSGQKKYEGAIMVLKSSGIESFSGLKGTKFLFVKATSTSGYKIPKGILREYNIDIDGFFDYDFSGGHDESIQALLEGKVQGIAIDSKAYYELKPEDQQKINILHEYDVPYHAYVFSPKLDEKFCQDVSKIMFNAKKNPATAQMFVNSLDIEKWRKCDDEYYNPLRRYLRLVRIKPYVNVSFDIKSSAKKELESKDDVIMIISDEIQYELKREKRFSTDGVNQNFKQNFHELVVVLSLIDGKYHYQINLNNNRIASGELEYKSLSKELPEIVVSSLLEELTIETELLYNGTDWFITYGSNDGIELSKYNFELISINGSKTKFNDNQIQRITPLNIIFEESDLFEKGAKIAIHYRHEEHVDTLAFDGAETGIEESFWDDKDNLWGVIGLGAALLTALVGMYFNRRKQKRFRNLLYQSNNLLKEYIESQYEIDTKIIEHTELVRNALEKGFINETQFMILNTRIEDIQKVIDKHTKLKTDLSNEFEHEIREILKDGKITEKEFTKIFAMLNQNNPQSNN